MLRRKLLVILAGVTTLLLVLAVSALWSMQSILLHLDNLSGKDIAMADEAHLLATTISGVELELYALQAGRKRHLDKLLDDAQLMRSLAAQLGQEAAGLPVQQSYLELADRVASFEEHITALASSQDPQLVAFHNTQSLTIAAALREQVMEVSRELHRHLQASQVALTSRFRWLVIGMALGFLLVINVSILLLLRLSEMILRPVEQLVYASRQLAAERFEHRVPLGNYDEFDELAKAFNNLAQQLQENEQRKIEMLGQVALALNHELNNAISIIELQLPLIRRQSANTPGGSGTQERYLKQIHDTLQRMTKVVESLKHVRRIVLTDYLAGVKMLDLAKSTDPTLPFPSARSSQVSGDPDLRVQQG